MATQLGTALADCSQVISADRRFGRRLSLINKSRIVCQMRQMRTRSSQLQQQLATGKWPLATCNSNNCDEKGDCCHTIGVDLAATLATAAARTSCKAASNRTASQRTSSRGRHRERERVGKGGERRQGRRLSRRLFALLLLLLLSLVGGCGAFA